MHGVSGQYVDECAFRLLLVVNHTAVILAVGHRGGESPIVSTLLTQPASISVKPSVPETSSDHFRSWRDQVYTSFCRKFHLKPA